MRRCDGVMAALALVVGTVWRTTRRRVRPCRRFNRDIAPILYQNCSNCHRPGEVAPFALLTYQDAAKRAKQIAAITQARVMPPWKAEPGYGDFLDVRRLTDQQIATDQRLGRAWRAGRRCRGETHAAEVSRRMAGRPAGPGIQDDAGLFGAGGRAGSVPLLRDSAERGSG